MGGGSWCRSEVAKRVEQGCGRRVIVRRELDRSVSACDSWMKFDAESTACCAPVCVRRCFGNAARDWRRRRESEATAPCARGDVARGGDACAGRADRHTKTRRNGAVWVGYADQRVFEFTR